MTKRKHWVGLVMWAGLLLVVAEGAAWAECGTCQFCKKDTRAFVFAYELCMVANEQSGSMCCREEDISFNKFCTLTGNACYGIIVDGGGGSGEVVEARPATIRTGGARLSA